VFFGRRELAALEHRQRTLLALSDMNRIALQTELEHLRQAAARVSEASRWPRKAAPLLFSLVPLAGFLFARRSGRVDSWLKHAITGLKWIGPLYRLWKGFSAGRAEAEARQQSA
jgi:hypothetical protein